MTRTVVIGPIMRGACACLRGGMTIRPTPPLVPTERRCAVVDPRLDMARITCLANEESEKAVFIERVRAYTRSLAQKVQRHFKQVRAIEEIAHISQEAGMYD